MGRRGPKPEPASVKRAKGNSGRRPIGDETPIEQQIENIAAAPALNPPKWLKRDGLVIWKRLAPRLIGQKLLFQIDAETFARYCKNFARWLKMQKVLDAEGETYESASPHGTYKRAHPAYLIADRLERQLTTAEANFGLNPAERQRLFAARASGSVGDLFGATKEKPSPQPQGKPPTGDSGSAVGFLN